jgi:hypothetical protein
MIQLGSRKRQLFSLLSVLVIVLLSFLMTACTPIQARTVEQRIFLNLSLEFLGDYQLPKTKFQNTPVGGISGLTYDRQLNKFYALSDDRSQFAPVRFYTLGLNLKPSATGKIGIENIEIEDVTFLRDENGKNYPKGSIDPEGIAVSPKGTVFISSEGNSNLGIAPFIGEFDLKTGKQRSSLPIPERYLPNKKPKAGEEARGIQNNLGFESLTLELVSLAAAGGDPFRLFTATESALLQDSLPANSQQPTPIRMMQYLIGNIARPMVVSEHLYLLDRPPTGTLGNGLTELLTLDTGGHFFSLERSYGLFGFGAKIYQLATGSATDISTITTLKSDLKRINAVKKRLVLDLADLGIPLDNFEGMTLGPRLADGSRSLLLVSDDNFQDTQQTRFLLFAVKGLT